mmetsp:Transcript_6351/g.13070  ORF Transcript_6351/g.13070 Transcript_6351/m.13070 type:complete len:108 (+) Transcript_6351:116-439(+)
MNFIFYSCTDNKDKKSFNVQREASKKPSTKHPSVKSFRTKTLMDVTPKIIRKLLFLPFYRTLTLSSLRRMRRNVSLLMPEILEYSAITNNTVMVIRSIILDHSRRGA